MVESTEIELIFRMKDMVVVIVRLDFEELFVGQPILILNGNKQVWRGNVRRLEMYGKAFTNARRGDTCAISLMCDDGYNNGIKKGMKIYKDQ